jgi:putative ABC transport system permease protein
MLINYFKIAFRNLQRHKAFSIINISGLAIGMACSIFILLWVWDELSYDSFHTRADRIYRLTASAGDFNAAISPAGMGAELRKRIPGIQDATRISEFSNDLFEVGEHKFQEKRVLYADSNFLQVFSFPLVSGSRSRAFDPGGVLLTEDMAIKYFGRKDVAGQTMRMNNGKQVKVNGVLANIPLNSHVLFDFLVPLSAIEATNDDLKTNTWENFNFYTYLQLDKPADATRLANINLAIDRLYKEHVSVIKVNFHLQPLRSIHFEPGLQIDLPGHGNRQYVRIFFIVAIFILVVACINFMNLATARSARRAKEVGLRKVVGAGRHQIIGQFLGESMLISVISFLLALGLVWLLMPAFNHLAEKNVSLKMLNGKWMIGLLSIAILTGLFSGIYPAVYLSGFRPALVLKGKLRSMGGNLIFRNALVITQFVVSIVLLVGTAIVFRQLHFIRDMNLGFEKKNLLYVPMTGDLWGKQQALKTELTNNPDTRLFSAVSDLPVDLHSGTINIWWEGKDPKTQVVVPAMYVDENFIDVFGMKMLQGRGFSKEFKSDTTAFVVNEALLKMMGKDPAKVVGQPFKYQDTKGTIIGVVKDFNFKPIQQAIEPLVLVLNRWGGFVFVRTGPAGTEATIHSLEKICHQLNPGFPFDYAFLDQNLANLYRGEQKIGSLFNVFALLAIFISCLGLYGLSAFIAEQRTREIGVRKVLGASVFGIVYLLSSNFTKVVLVAIAIAIPISWYAANSWLRGFAYHINIGWGVFVLASLMALIVAWCTMSFESVKSAVANPAKSLRTE